MIDINQVIESLDWSKDPKGLYEPIGYTLASGGKRIITSHYCTMM